ncbi:MAG: S46 family peptidase [Planctomycetes bacterium]|nr:S46 family peptidase [Planctomycetota bacterium]
MKKLAPALVALLVLALPRFTSVSADEGMWVPPAIGKRLPMETLKKMGFELTREQLWSAGPGSLRSAFLQVGSLGESGPLDGYGSASFVSSKGLVVTNHHVAFDALAALSKPEENLIETGFSAATMADERPCRGLGMRITTLYEDVTERMLDGLDKDDDEATRSNVLAENKRALIAEAKEKGFKDVAVEEMLYGLAFYRVAYDTFRDIRMVHAPPRAIGEYGGDIDNWMWPRHTGDYTFLRVYVAPDGSRANYAEENVPYEPDSFLKVSLDGVTAGDFTFIMGYPGSTQRHRSSYSVEYWEDFVLPQQVDGLKSMAANLEEKGRNDEEARIASASDLKSIYNTIKNYEGKIEGLARTHLVAQKRAREMELSKWIKEDPARVAKYGDPFGELADLYANGPVRTGVLQSLANSGALGLYLNAQLAQARGQVPDTAAEGIADQIMAQLVPEGLDAQRERMTKAFSRFWTKKDGWRPAALAGLNVDETEVGAYVAELLPAAWDRSKVVAYLTGADVGETPLAKLGESLFAEFREANMEMRGFGAKIGDVRRRMVAAMEDWTKAAIYPDANLTIRFTYGKVTGYSPKDAVSYDWYTTAEGIIEKNSGVEPFIAPDKVVDLVAKKDWGRYGDKRLGKMVVNFLTDNDITGGNSGSPIMNGRGELIGLAFDGNYEAMTSDYQFQPEITRTINVDIRYVLWCAEKVGGMKRLVDEMTIVAPRMK